MSFQTTNLSVLAYANGFTLWHYRETGPVAEIEGDPNYFSEFSKVFNTGDFIFVNAMDLSIIFVVTCHPDSTITVTRL
ncbi:MAG: hypothetical protein LBR35_00040 [Rickettsiales bacterium]|jgi:hypothetical protein|nr:hypothetical protein [Rickettsiales bacterium]